MAKFTVRVNPKNGQNLRPKDLRRDGFCGQVTGLTGAMIIVFIKPGAKLSDIHASLGVVRSDILIRMESKEEKRKMTGRKGSTKAMGQGIGPPYPIFLKFSRKWLRDITGYSVGYLCRVATGHQSLSEAFVTRCCFKLNQTEEELFGPQVVSK